MKITNYQKATELVELIKEMERVESFLRDADRSAVQINLQNPAHLGGNWILPNDDGGKFVIDKMIEAGAYAAMTVRAAAENDLEKL